MDNPMSRGYHQNRLLYNGSSRILSRLISLGNPNDLVSHNQFEYAELGEHTEVDQSVREFKRFLALAFDVIFRNESEQSGIARAHTPVEFDFAFVVTTTFVTRHVLLQRKLTCVYGVDVPCLVTLRNPAPSSAVYALKALVLPGNTSL